MSNDLPAFKIPEQIVCDLVSPQKMAQDFANLQQSTPDHINDYGSVLRMFIPHNDATSYNTFLNTKIYEGGNPIKCLDRMLGNIDLNIKADQLAFFKPSQELFEALTACGIINSDQEEALKTEFNIDSFVNTVNPTKSFLQ